MIKAIIISIVGLSGCVLILNMRVSHIEDLLNIYRGKDEYKR